MCITESILVFDDVLAPADIARLASVAAAVQDSHRDDATVWLAHAWAPRCLVDQVAAALRPWAPASSAGGEWWFHMQPCAADLRLHFEKDDALARETGALRRPDRSLILYLSERGGPTVFTDQTYRSPTEVYPVDPTQYALVEARRNRLVSFDSALYHGVLRDEVGSGLRQSFLVNWWGEPPSAPDCTLEIGGVSSARAPAGAPIEARVTAGRSVGFIRF